jgi:lambda family phage portal protein
VNLLETIALAVAPGWALKRARARYAAVQIARHYEAAQPGRRTSGWARQRGDANAVGGVALAELRMHARDLVRNNGWARRVQRVIANNTVGWGIVPRPTGPEAKKAAALWKSWADAPTCGVEGRSTFGAIQALSARSVVADGEVLVRRIQRPAQDGVPLNLQLQVLEADHIDTAKEEDTSEAGGPIIQGVEFDNLGRRAAYWLFATHPGGKKAAGVSARVPAEDIAHVYYEERPGQVRGVSWLGSSIVPLKDLDEYEDATLVRQKIAACFAAFVTDDGTSGLGAEDENDAEIESFEPGMIVRLPPGKQVTTASPPATLDDSFTGRNLRKVAAGMGVTYEDQTGDYSGVNFSSARMARLSHWANIEDYRWHMFVPQLCWVVWQWFCENASAVGELKETPPVDWTAPPMPMIEPAQEGLAYQRLMRSGVMTHAEMVRERGGDPDAHWKEYAAGLDQLDELGIMLDSDPRKTSAAGLTQARTGIGDTTTPDPTDEAPAKEDEPK